MKTTFKDCRLVYESGTSKDGIEVTIASIDESIDSIVDVSFPTGFLEIGDSCHPADDPTDILGRVEECVITWPKQWQDDTTIVTHMRKALESLLAIQNKEDVDLEEVASDLIRMAAAAIVKARQIDPPAVDDQAEESAGTP